MDEKKNITPVLSDETDAASVPDAGELRRKKKRQRQLVTSILLVVFAAVLIAVYFIVAPLLSEDGNAADTTETEAVSVSAHQSSEVLSLTFPSSEESEGTITAQAPQTGNMFSARAFRSAIPSSQSSHRR